ncbi:hypothetical protein CR513_23101, partial [Mucuna pruriens]
MAKAIARYYASTLERATDMADCCPVINTRCLHKLTYNSHCKGDIRSSDSEMFRRVEIYIPLLDAIKQILKYVKFVKELCMHKRKKLKGGVEIGGVMLALIKNEELIVRSQQVLPKKCRDPKIFSVPCTIGDVLLSMPCWT